MRQLLLIFGLSLALVGNQVYAERFYATPVDRTYSECIEAIEKGVAILTEPTATIFYYKDAMYVISPVLLSAAMDCYVQEFNEF